MSAIRNTLVAAYKGRIYPNYWDILALLFVLTIIGLFAWNAKQMSTPYHVGQIIPISLDPHQLPAYAARTVVRMLIALFFSLLFTFVVGTFAAKSHRAERIIIPMIDILQSVPILGYLSVFVPMFIRLFPGSFLGPECAAIFVIFTSQAWNMTFGFYQTIRSVPNEVQEASRMFHLSAWQRFWRIEVPYSMPGLLWNAMASMSAGWFFVVAAEAITVAHQDILLPGIGSYIATAIQQANLQMIIYAILAMFIVIIIYDQLLFRPLVAWAEKFKAEHQTDDEGPESWVINLFRRTRLLRNLGVKIAHLSDAIVNLNVANPSPVVIYKKNHQPILSEKWQGIIWDMTIFISALSAFAFLMYGLIEIIGIHEVWHAFGLGLITAGRVFVMIFLCSLLWVPLGVWIGLRPRVSQIAQPIAQILAAFPANLFYPFVVMFIVTYHLNPNIWLTPLMILGAQWYILFNVIAGAGSLPKDLLQAVDNLGVTGWLRWSRLVLPGIFPYYVTGAITAAGGAWNASIVAEVASWGDKELVATGLGAYITQYTTQGDFAHTALGIAVMCILVLIFNRLLWRPLYVYAENRFVVE